MEKGEILVTCTVFSILELFFVIAFVSKKGKDFCIAQMKLRALLSWYVWTCIKHGNFNM